MAAVKFKEYSLWCVYKDTAIYKSKRKFLYTKREKSSGPTCDVDDKYYNLLFAKGTYHAILWTSRFLFYLICGKKGK